MSEETKILSIEEILEVEDSKTTTVHVEEWGGSVTIRTLSAEESEVIENYVLSKKQPNSDGLRNVTGFRELVLSKTLVKEDGKTPFATPAQLKGLLKKSAKAVSKVFDAAMEHNGLSVEAKQELEKN